MLGHVDDDRAGGVRVDLGGVRVFAVQNVARELDDCALEAEANAQKRAVVGSSPVGGSDLSFHPAGTEAPRHENT